MSEIKTPYASRISGTGSFFPEKTQTNVELAEILAKDGIETNDEWIRERTGIIERRVAQWEHEPEYNSTMGYQASLQAMEMAGIGPDDIDQILYATCSPDTLIPSTACWLQRKLEAKRAWAVDLNAACSGFVYAVSMADQYIKTGHAKNILVVGAELLTAFLNYKDRSSCILFGDGAGAAVMTRVDPEDPRRIFSSHLHSDGNLWDLFHIPGGGSKLPLNTKRIEDQQGKMWMKGREIFKVATRTLADYAAKALEANDFTLEDLDWVVPHQANLRILEAVAKRLGLPMEKMVINVDRFGNTSAATVPTALDQAVRDGRIKEGHLVLLDVFGAGLTNGSVLMRW